MELRQYLSLIGKWVWLIILSVLIAGGSSYFASRATTPLYRTKTTLMVGRATQNPDPNSAELYTGQQLAYTYSQLAGREPVLKGAIENLGLQMNWEQLADQVSTNLVQQTQLLEIIVIDVDPYRAKVLADAIAQQLILQSPAGTMGAGGEDLAFIQEQLDELKIKIGDGQDEVKRLKQELDAANSAILIQDLENQIDVLETKISGWQTTYSQLLASLQGGNVNTLNVVEQATIPSSPISPNVAMNVLLASAIGLILAVGGVFIMEYLDDTVKTPEDIDRLTKLPILGAIPNFKGKTYSDKLITALELADPAIESFRSLRTNIQYSSFKPIRSLLVTSPGPSEGKSICLANLAVVMAQAGFKVVIVDADLRRPIQDQIFSVSNDTGLSDVILADYPVGKEVLQTTNIENLRLLTAGPLLPNPYKLIESARMKTIIQQLQDESDIVLFDSPPALMVTDAAILGTQVDGTLIVVEAGHTRSADTRRAVDELKRLHVHLMGVILNRTSYNQNNHYYYYYRKDGHEKRIKAPQDQGITQNASMVKNEGKKQRKSKELN